MTKMNTATSTKPKRKRSRRQILTDKADQYFSWYIRLRDSQPQANGRWGECITCQKEYLVAYRDDVTGKIRWTNFVDNGHFIGRSYFVTRYDDENCNLQCKRCNKWRGGEREKYRVALADKYGTGVPEKLEKIVGHYGQSFKLSLEDLEQIIEDAKEQIKFYEKEM